MPDLDGRGQPTCVSKLDQPCPQPGLIAAPALQVVRAANEVNDGDFIGQSFSSVSAGTDSTVENNFVVSENNRIRKELKNIYRCNRCQCAKGKHPRRRHVNMSAEDLNNVQSIREFLRRKCSHSTS